jgi:hypothetical protein
MLLRTVVRDCLYVNWALPRQQLPPPPEPLRYELHRHGSESYGFVSAVLFRQRGLRLAAVPWLRLSYPQLNVRCYVLDEEGVPAVLFHSLLVPGWVVPLARVTGQGWLARAHLEFPRPSLEIREEAWTWRAVARGCLEISGRAASPRTGGGPQLGAWPRTCDYFRRRDRGFVLAGDRLRRIETSHGTTTSWPMEIEVGDDALVRGVLGMPATEAWPSVHSAWLCPQVPLDFEIAAAKPVPIGRRVPAPG